LSTLVAHTQTGATPAQKARHDHYHELGDAFKAVSDQNRKPSPDFAIIEKNAQFVSDASVDQNKWFAKGTGPEAGKTRALGDIWTKPQDFAAAQKLFSDSAPKLLAAAKSKDAAAVQSSFGEVGKSCKGCHDAFRAPEDE
jgi:cytochrome c556